MIIRLFNIIAGRSLGESYSSVEIQSVYSAGPADWANNFVRTGTTTPGQSEFESNGNKKNLHIVQFEKYLV